MCGHDYEALKQRAHTRQHRSFELQNTRLSMTIRNSVRTQLLLLLSRAFGLACDHVTYDVLLQLKFYSSHNFVARIEGVERPTDHVVFSAHWDHLGKKDDQVFSGAVDNGSGCANSMRWWYLVLTQSLVSPDCWSLRA